MELKKLSTPTKHTSWHVQELPGGTAHCHKLADGPYGEKTKQGKRWQEQDQQDQSIAEEHVRSSAVRG